MSTSEPAAAGRCDLDPSKAIKLVIWDLDETFWTGTLSEGEIQLIDKHIQIVRNLNDRGIANSICSKNDVATARVALNRAPGLWDEFVFPAIAWQPKGSLIRSVIEAMQLRAPNVLFIDDNVLNLEEARFYCPGLQAATPEIIDSLLTLPALSGKDDRARTRLNQYRQLQQKWEAREASGASNVDFLRASNIRVAFSDAVSGDIDRITELIERTNQLNYTKRRLDSECVRALVDNPAITTLGVRVADDYGDYGLCGFIAYTDDEVLDFLFSCRILHMGVENWVAQELRLPEFKPIGEVATPLVSDPIDWIRHVSDLDPSLSAHDDRPEPSRSGIILMKGGCDLELVQNFIGGSISTEFSRPSRTGALMHWHHTDFLEESICKAASSLAAVIHQLPFAEPSLFESKLRTPDAYDTVVYSLIMDCTQGRYRYRESDLIIPFEQYNRDLTDRTKWPGLVDQYGAQGLTVEFLEWFSQEFVFLGSITTSEFACRISSLLAGSPNTQFVFLNAPEVPFYLETELQRHTHHAKFNAALDTVVAEYANATLCDLREIVRSTDDVTINLRHYPRRVYLDIARNLAAMIAQMSFHKPSTAQRVRRRLAATAHRLIGHSARRLGNHGGSRPWDR